MAAVAWVVVVVLSLMACGLWANGRHLRRANFVRTYKWPPGLLDKLVQKHPTLTRKDAALVANGLRQYFLAYLKSGRKSLAMPSQVVDDLWHEFTLHGRAYRRFCRRALGRFMHHVPALAVNAEQGASNEGLRRTWLLACLDENIDPRAPTRLPLLFALDGKLNIGEGFRYDLGDATANTNAMTLASAMPQPRWDDAPPRSPEQFNDKRTLGNCGGCGGG